jgi:lipopolysaccharide transport system permease protein
MAASSRIAAVKASGLAGEHREEPTVHLTNRPAHLSTLLRETWQARGLMMLLARRDFYVRYRRAALGVLWAVLLPLSQAVVLSLVLGRVTHLASSSAAPYPVFVIAGITAWSFFSTAMSAAATSIVDGSGMSTKVYFPRMLLPAVSVSSAAIGFVLNTGVLLLLCVFFGIGLSRILLLVPAVLLAAALTMSFGLVLSVAYVYFRDVRYLLDAAQRAWFYVTPVFYSLNRLGSFRPFILANPATGVVELYRAGTVGADPGWLPSLWWSLGWTAVMGALGLWLHRKHDRLVTDLL